MLRPAWFLVALNGKHILGTYRTLDEAVEACEDHSVGCPSARYAIFQLAEPVKTATMGDTIKWN